jgi:hypothetical protein
MVFSKAKIIFAALAATVLVSSPATASTNSAYGYVSTFFGTLGGAVLFSVSGPARSGVPSCAQNFPSRWAIDASTISGQSASQLIQMAYLQHLQVYATGSGVCSIWGDTETVLYFNIGDPPY